MAESQIISKPSDNPLLRIKMALTEMASFRMAKVDAAQLSLFARRLAKENLDDVLSALATLAELPREEGENSFPEIGVILSSVGMERVARHNREGKAQGPQDIIRWECDGAHKHHCMGFYYQSEPTPKGKTCRCGANLQMLSREPA